MFIIFRPEVARLVFSCIAAFFALVNVALSCMKMGGHGDYEHRTRAIITIAAFLSPVSIGLYVGLDAVLIPTFGYMDSRRMLWNQLSLFSECGNLLASGFTIHAQFRLAFYTCNRRTKTLRWVALALFVLPQLLNLVFFIMGQMSSIGYTYGYGFDVAMAMKVVWMLANVFVWYASISSLVVYAMCWRRRQVVVQTGFGGCLLAANIITPVRHTWSAIIYIVNCASVLRQRDGYRGVVYPPYFDLGTRIVVLWTAPTCILLLIIAARRGLRGSDASHIGERHDAVPLTQVPAPVHDSSGSEPVKTTWT